MKLFFNLDYQTTFGEELALNVLTADGNTKHYKMGTLDGLHWTCEMKRAAKDGNYMDYYYTLERRDEVVRQEWLVQPHRLEFAAVHGIHYTVYDHWLDIPEDSYMFSSAFTECVAKRQRQFSTASEFKRTIRLKVRAPQLRQNERLGVVGGNEYLGNWNARLALPMAEHEYHEWVVSLNADCLPRRFEFKFVIISDNEPPIWENGMNRTIEQLPDDAGGDVVVYELPRAPFPVYPWKGAGTVIPVFSLRSEGSFGVGDFGDLKRMIDWCDKTFQRILQLLPINDTNITKTWQDSYPYNSISIYALHPQYCDLRQLPSIKDEATRTQFEQLRQELNALPKIDYERMFKAKMDYLRIIFGQEWTAVQRRDSYKQFFSQNREWLEPYAAFCVFRDNFGTVTTSEWPEEAVMIPKTIGKDDKWSAQKIAKACKAKVADVNRDLNFWYYVQYHLDQQMRATHAYAREHRVILKGDIPIGISRDSVEAWVEPRFFNMNGQAGAPPDAFSEDGQNWGFPTYNWDEMMKDGCQWWVKRFRKMAQYFDAYRIDHVLGFFRIWEIPMPQKSGLYGQFQPSLPMTREEVEAYGIPFREAFFLEDHKRKNVWHPRINATRMEEFNNLDHDEQLRFWNLYNDYFYRRNNQYWYQEAMKKLPRLTQATRMLCCAEDLGMVPECVPWVMNELRILSLEIQSMPKEPNLTFGKLSHNPYRSVCTISTHDMPTLRQWWDEDEQRTQEYYTTRLHGGGNAPHPLPGWLAKDIVNRFLTSPSMLCLISLQDWLSIDEQLRLPDVNGERINIPANPRHYWRYRMHLTIEQLLGEDKLNDTIRTLINQSGRK